MSLGVRIMLVIAALAAVATGLLGREVVDISATGARLDGSAQPVAGRILAEGNAAVLAVERLPVVPVRVVRRADDRLLLQFDFANAAQQQTMEAAIATLQRGRAA